MELLTQLGIDWKLLLAQIVNFLILLFILYKFLYHPILEMLEKRSAKIEKSLADAKKIGEEVKRIEKMKEEQIIEAKKEAKKIIEEAQAKAENNRQELIVKTKEEIQNLTTEAKKQIAAEKEKLSQEVKAEIGALVVEATQKVIGKSLTDKLDEKIIKETIKEIEKDKL